jgi:hypothetical protein
MIQAILAAAIITAASLVCGQALMLASGRRGFSPVAPALGLSALLVVCGVAVKLPGHGVSAAIAAALATGVAGWFLWRDRRRDDAGLGAVSPWAIAAALLAALVVAIPFLTSGRVGILGQGLVNDDMASHLLFTEWVDTREGPTPDLIEDGYPLGPHAIVSAASKATGADLIEAFAGLTGAIAVLAALTAYGALGGLRPWLRVPASALAALPYLGAAYLAQGAFKEPMLALALVGFALSLPALRECWWGYSPTIASTVAGGGRSWLKGQVRLAIPGGVIAAGTIYNYSFPGLAWLVVALAAWALIVALHERNERQGLQLRSRLRWARPVLIAGVVIPVALAVPELVRIVSFAGFEAFSPSGTEGNTGFGNLRQALNPLEALGVWPSSEFRIAPQNSDTPVLAFYLGGLLALAALAWGVGRAVARREAALPAALVAGAAGYLVALAVGTPYTSAKALAILAPVVMLVALRGLLSAEPVEGEGDKEEDWWPPGLLRPVIRFAVPALAAAFIAAAAFSTLLPLRQSAVGPRENTEVLKSFRPLVEGEDLLFLGRDNFISWELLGAEVYSPILNHYDTEETATLYRATPINAKFDWDNVPNEVLADFDLVLTTTAALNSQPPLEFTEAKRTDDFVLWERREGAETPAGGPGERHTLLEPLYPGTTVDCSDPGKAGLRKLKGAASVFPLAPVIGKTWEPGAEPTDARGAAQTLELSPGSWAISIQYASTQEMTISAPGLDRTMRANLLFRGPSTYYPVGTIDIAGEGVAATGGKVPVEFEVRVGEPPLLGRILGTEARAYLGTIAATPIAGGPLGERLDPPPAPARETIPLPAACDRYVDWYTVAPGQPDPDTVGVEAPAVRPPDEEK